jgi:hypothetical protein
MHSVLAPAACRGCRCRARVFVTAVFVPARHATGPLPGGVDVPSGDGPWLLGRRRGGAAVPKHVALDREHVAVGTHTPIRRFSRRLAVFCLLRSKGAMRYVVCFGGCLSPCAQIIKLRASEGGAGGISAPFDAVCGCVLCGLEKTKSACACADPGLFLDAPLTGPRHAMRAPSVHASPTVVCLPLTVYLDC